MRSNHEFGAALFTTVIVGTFLAAIVGGITYDMWKGIEAQNLSNN